MPESSFFLFGPRNTGKSTWLSKLLPVETKVFDLLETKVYLQLQRDPHILESLIDGLGPTSWVWIDEVQKVPRVLDEVHRLIEKRRFKFALSGSSARKLLRCGANLLAGRAVTRSFEGLVAKEMGEDFSYDHALKWGTLPLAQASVDKARDFLNGYVHTYIKEEIKEEGVVRNLDPFVRFLTVSGMMNGQIVNGSNLAKEAQISRNNVDNYFQILTDTFVGYFLEAYRPKIKVREVTHPKFYWFDFGVARGAAGLLYEDLGHSSLGTSLETLVFHDLRVYNQYARKHRYLYYYAIPSGGDIDFVVELRKKTIDHKAEVLLIEVKLSKRWDRKWEHAARSFAQKGKVVVKKMMGIYGGDQAMEYDGFLVLPYQDFTQRLFQGEIF